MLCVRSATCSCWIKAALTLCIHGLRAVRMQCAQNVCSSQRYSGWRMVLDSLKLRTDLATAHQSSSRPSGGYAPLQSAGDWQRAQAVRQPTARQSS